MIKEWYEDMPKGCPPIAAQPDEGNFYRLVSNPPTTEDFMPQSRKFPTKKFGKKECQARAISLFRSIEDCKNVRKLPAHKNEQVAKVHINKIDGVVLSTPTALYESHVSWWRAIKCQILNYTIIDNE